MFHLIVKGTYPESKVNPKLEIIKAVFKKAEKELVIHKTEYKGHAKDIASTLTKDGETNLIAMGGDGTLHEVLNGIEDVSKCTLGIIPYGHGNDFANAMKVPMDVRAAAEVIAFKAPYPIDYIQLENGLRSINAVGLGMDVAVLQKMYANKDVYERDETKNRYLSAFMNVLKSYKCTRFKLSWDGCEPVEMTGFIACLGNGKSIGGGITLFPEAVANDGYMDLYAVNCLSKMRIIFAFLKLMRGKAHKIKGALHVKCKTAEVYPEGGTAPIQAEGEIYEDIPLKAKIVEGGLKFYLPKL